MSRKGKSIKGKEKRSLKRFFVVIMGFLLIITGLVGCSSDNNEKTYNKKEENVMVNFQEVKDSFNKLQEMDSNVRIDEFWSTASHGDNEEEFSAILEQAQFILELNPKQNKGTYVYTRSMFNVLKGEISMNTGSVYHEATYENLKKNYINDTKPYSFTLENDKITKLKNAPSFYCDSCVGTYKGVNKYGDERNVTDSFGRDEAGEISLGLGGAFGNDRLFNWLEGYTNGRLRGQISMPEIDNDHFTVSVENNGKGKLYKFTEDLSSFSEEEKQDIPYLSHGNTGIWEIKEVYFIYQIDKEGYPLSYQSGIDSKHIKLGNIVPTYYEVSFKR